VSDEGFASLAGPFASPIGGLTWDGECVLASLPGEDRVVAIALDGSTKELRRHSAGTTRLAMGAGGRVFACQPRARRVACLEPDGRATVPAQWIDGRLPNRPFDLDVDARGRVWFSDRQRRGASSPLFPARPGSSVLRLESSESGSWEQICAIDQVPGPGALAVAPDDSALYLVRGHDVEPGVSWELLRYPISGPEAGPPGVLARGGQGVFEQVRSVSDLATLPDGDVALLGASSGGSAAIWRMTPEGAITDRVELPPESTCLALGSPGEVFVGGVGGMVFRQTRSALWAATEGTHPRAAENPERC